MQKFENRLRFDEVTEGLKVGTFLRHNVEFLGVVNVILVLAVFVQLRVVTDRRTDRHTITANTMLA